MAHVAREGRNGEVILDLSTNDLSEVSWDELSQWVTHVVVHSMLGTPAGPRIDREKLQTLLDSHLATLLKGDHLDFAPILAALLRIPHVTEADLYVGVISLIGQLASMGLMMEEPAFKLTPRERAELIDAAFSETEQARDEYHGHRIRSAVHALHKQRIGELLVSEGLIDIQQLQEGLEAQQEMGGRIGSILVRMGFITEEQLAAFLGRQLGLPCLTRLERVSPEALRRLPRHLAEKYQVVPISANDRELGLAMADPANLEAIDQVQFTTGLRVRPAVVPELLIDYALARFYGVRRPTRLRRLDVHRAKAGSGDLVPGPAALDLDLLTADIAEPWEEPESPGDDIAALSGRLAAAERPAQVLDLLTQYLTEHFATALVFTLDGTRLKVRACSGAHAAALRDSDLDVHDDPALSDAFVRRSLYFGSEPHGHHRFTDLLGLPEASLLSVIPVMEHDHVVAMLVGNARRKPSQDPMAEDQNLTRVASLAMSMATLRQALLTTAHR
ncbi:MAG: hypothetical protein H6730_35230 [Deltaproteobacteria bacterium]|nr:hypothetical protein [Deltaproteobacteria bacterium]